MCDACKEFLCTIHQEQQGGKLGTALDSTECALLLLNEAFLFSIKFIIYHTS